MLTYQMSQGAGDEGMSHEGVEVGVILLPPTAARTQAVEQDMITPGVELYIYIYMYIYICMYVYNIMYIYNIHIYIHTHTHTHTHSIYVYIYTYIYIHKYTYEHI